MDETQPDSIAVQLLLEGIVLERDIYDVNGVLLLRAGSPVTGRLIQHLRARGIREVRRGGDAGTQDRKQKIAADPEAAGPDTKHLETPATRELDDLIDQVGAPPMPPTASASRTRLDLPELKEQLKTGLQQYRQRSTPMPSWPPTS